MLATGRHYGQSPQARAGGETCPPATGPVGHVAQQARAREEAYLPAEAAATAPSATPRAAAHYSYESCTKLCEVPQYTILPHLHQGTFRLWMSQ